MQIGRRHFPRIGLQRLQPGQEGSDADTAGNPDLPGPRVATGDIKAAVGALHTYRLARLQLPGKAAGVVTEGLDLATHDAIALIRTGDGEWVRTLFVIESDEGELPGAMAVPGTIKATAHGLSLIHI